MGRIYTFPWWEMVLMKQNPINQYIDTHNFLKTAFQYSSTEFLLLQGCIFLSNSAQIIQIKIYFKYFDSKTVNMWLEVETKFSKKDLLPLNTPLIKIHNVYI